MSSLSVQMENHQIPSLGWAYYYQGKNVEELKHSLLCTTLELETTRIAAQEEIRRMEEEMKQIKDLLNRAVSDRDEANDKCQRLLLLLQQQQHQPQQQQHLHHNPVTAPEEEIKRGDSISSSECEESIVSGSPARSIGMIEVEATGALPEKGKLLQAVMKAGPLLQTLLLAGPLPQWRHPPPPLDSLDIPPVVIPLDNKNMSTIGNKGSKKRPLEVCQGSEDSSSTKYQKIVLH